MPKKWLWTIILIITPVTGIALTILTSQVTAELRFAEKDTVLIQGQRICAVEKAIKKIVDDQEIEREKQTKTILEAIEKIKK